MSLDTELILGAIGKLFDDLNARWERRLPKFLPAQEASHVISVLTPTTTVGAAIIADNWGGGFNGGEYSFEQHCVVPSIVADNWGRLFDRLGAVPRRPRSTAMDSESVYQNCKELESEFLTSLVAHAPSPEEAMVAMGAAADAGGFARFDPPSPLDPYDDIATTQALFPEFNAVPADALARHEDDRATISNNSFSRSATTSSASPMTSLTSTPPQDGVPVLSIFTVVVDPEHNVTPDTDVSSGKPLMSSSSASATVATSKLASPLIWTGITLDLDWSHPSSMAPTPSQKAILTLDLDRRHSMQKGACNLFDEMPTSAWRILNPAFHLEKLKLMLPVFSTCCEELVSRWAQALGPDGSCERDVDPELQTLTGDVISHTAFDSSYLEGRKILHLQVEQVERLMSIIDKFTGIHVLAY
ncbi:uncharacterized protein [Zea mays]|nr:uncharacterized protein LOC118477058 [Zea mays]